MGSNTTTPIVAKRDCPLLRRNIESILCSGAARVRGSPPSKVLHMYPATPFLQLSFLLQHFMDKAPSTTQDHRTTIDPRDVSQDPEAEGETQIDLEKNQGILHSSDEGWESIYSKRGRIPHPRGYRKAQEFAARVGSRGSSTTICEVPLG